MLFSIIIPIYNEKDYIFRCIDSVLSQDFEDYEVILIDDGSTDGCSIICDEYAKKDYRIHVIHTKNNGLVSARNTGIKQAQGEYILYVDGDDWVSKNLLEIISNQISSSPEKPDIIVFGATSVYADRRENYVINASEGFYNKARLEKEIIPSLISDRSQQYIGDSIILPAPWNKAYKRNLLEKYHCYDEKIKVGEDTAFVFECLLNAQNIVICRNILYYYNKQNPNSILSKNDSKRFRNRLRLFKYLKKHLSHYGPIIDQQMDDFYASRIIYDVIYMSRRSSGINKTALYLKKELKTTKILKYVHIKKVPLRAGIVIFMLKIGLYRTVLWGFRLLNK